MLELINYLMHHGQDLCVSGLAFSRHKDLYAALVCGQNLSAGTDKRVFIDTGLFHILVVSGAHLTVVGSLVGFLPPVWRLVPLGVYTWLCDFGAPIVRAWWRRVLGLLFRSVFPSRLQIEFVTMIITLLFYPPWVTSRSFIMSWLCALALSLPSHPRLGRSLSFCIYCYVFLFPLSPSTPMTVLINLLLAPLIGGFLFPLCALTMVIPSLTGLVDALWDFLLAVLNILPMAPPAPWTVSSKWLVAYPLFVHLFLLVAEVPWRRARAYSH